jgi:hypothetical protein
MSTPYSTGHSDAPQPAAVAAALAKYGIEISVEPQEFRQQMEILRDELKHADRVRRRCEECKKKWHEAERTFGVKWNRVQGARSEFQKCSSGDFARRAVIYLRALDEIREAAGKIKTVAAEADQLMAEAQTFRQTTLPPIPEARSSAGKLYSDCNTKKSKMEQDANSVATLGIAEVPSIASKNIQNLTDAWTKLKSELEVSVQYARQARESYNTGRTVDLAQKLETAARKLTKIVTRNGAHADLIKGVDEVDSASRTLSRYGVPKVPDSLANIQKELEYFRKQAVSFLNEAKSAQTATKSQRKDDAPREAVSKEEAGPSQTVPPRKVPPPRPPRRDISAGRDQRYIKPSSAARPATYVQFRVESHDGTIASLRIEPGSDRYRILKEDYFDEIHRAPDGRTSFPDDGGGAPVFQVSLGDWKTVNREALKEMWQTGTRRPFIVLGNTLYMMPIRTIDMTSFSFLEGISSNQSKETHQGLIGRKRRFGPNADYFEVEATSDTAYEMVVELIRSVFPKRKVRRA